MSDRVLLTDQREKVLNGDYDGSDAALRNQKSRLRKSSQTALQELIKVASSPAIDNPDVFDTEDVYTLVSLLLNGRGGLSHGDEIPHPDEVREQYDSYDAIAWRPREDYRQELYVKLDGNLRNYHDTDG